MVWCSLLVIYYNTTKMGVTSMYVMNIIFMLQYANVISFKSIADGLSIYTDVIILKNTNQLTIVKSINTRTLLDCSFQCDLSMGCEGVAFKYPVCHILINTQDVYSDDLTQENEGIKVLIYKVDIFSTYIYIYGMHVYAI